MEDDAGLELSLGLSCGGSSNKSKGKSESFLDTRIEAGDRVNKSGDDFKNFLHSGIPKQDSGTGSQRSDSVRPQESFFNDLTKASMDAYGFTNFNGRGHLVAKTNSSTENKEDTRSEVGDKHRIFFNEISHQTKRKKEGHHADLNDRTRSHISITTDDGLSSENEDVAESEVECLTSRLVSRHDSSSSEVRGFDSTVVDSQEQKRFTSSSENEFKMGNMICGVPFSIQSVNATNAPYSLPMKESISVVTSSTSTHPLAGMIQGMPAANSERSGTQPVTSANLPVMLSYSPVQFPEVQANTSWSSMFRPQQLHPSFAARGPPNSAAVQLNSHNPSEASQFGLKTLEWSKRNVKQHVVGEGSSFQTEDVKESSMNFKTKDAAERSVPESFSLDFSPIKPGIAAEMKFGGCGSYPDLPWVSTKGPGPNGRTISGVTYKYNANQIRIVCACHGTHMSPEEFVRHASEEHANPDSGTGVANFPSSNPAASAQS